MKNLIIVSDKFSDIAPRPSEVRHNYGDHVKGTSVVRRDTFEAITLDPESERFFAITSNLTLYTLEPNSYQAMAETSLTELGDVPVEGRVISMDYIPEQDALAMAFSGGELLIFYPEKQEIELVGALQGGIYCLAWSPDGEIVAVATGLGRLLLLTKDWEVLAEVDLEQTTVETAGAAPSGRPADQGLSGKVEISWRSDGQFMATVSRTNLGLSHMRLRVWEREGCVLHSCSELGPDLTGPVAWQPQGALLAVAASPGGGLGPEVMLYERNGLKRGKFSLRMPPGATVEELRWNSDSELLGVVVRWEETTAIQIWNRANYHWYLKAQLHSPPTKRCHLLWDLEQPLRMRCWTTTGTLRHVDMIWESAAASGLGTTATVIDGADLRISPLEKSMMPPPMCEAMIRFAAPCQCVAAGRNSEGRHQVAAVLSDGQVAIAACHKGDRWQASEGELDGDENPILVGSSAKLFNGARHLAWLGPQSLLAAVPARLMENQNAEGNETALAEARHEDVLVKLLVTQKGVSNQTENSVDDPLLSPAAAMWHVEVKGVRYLNAEVIRIVSHQEPADSWNQPRWRLSGSAAHEGAPGGAFVQLRDGSLQYYTEDQELDEFRTVWKFPEACPWMKTEVLGDANTIVGELVLVGLSDQGKLYVNSHLVTTDCSSFVLHCAGRQAEIDGASPGHLLKLPAGGGKRVVSLVYITRQNICQTVNLETLQNSAPPLAPTASQLLPLGTLGTHNIARGTRSKDKRVLSWEPVWEKGSRLVAALGGRQAAVIRQVPRGSLEITWPRPLVVVTLARALQDKDFRAAVELARRHRLDLNLLVDYGGWRHFASCAAEFVQQVKRPSHISEVVCALRQENVCDTAYQGLLPPFPTPSPDASSEPAGKTGEDSGKVTGVCTAVRTALEQALSPGPAREMCVLTTYARCDPPQLEEALLRIKALRDAELSLGLGEMPMKEEREEDEEEAAVVVGLAGVPEVGAVSAGAALKHLMWLADADRVYDVALGMYDLPLAAMVAAHSQQDPREFLPFLRGLEEMPPLLMKATIDLRLNRLEGALRHLARAGPEHFPECLALVEANPHLFPLAAELFEGTAGGRRTSVVAAWGRHLAAQERFEDAAAAFLAGGFLKEAMDAYRRGGHWRSVFIMAGRLQFSEAQMRQLADDISEELQAMGKAADAALVALEYCDDAETAVKLLAAARIWQDVMRLAYARRRGDLVDSLIGPAALDAARSQVEEFEDATQKVAAYLARLKGLRQKRAALSAQLAEAQEQGWGGEGQDDAASEISTAVGALSIYTHGTGPSRTPSEAPSGTTVASKSGGRRTSRRAARRAAQGPAKIRAGSPGEERALLDHLIGLAPPARTREETGQLLELLLVLGHDLLARELQGKLQHLLRCHTAAVEEAAEGEKLPGSDVASKAALPQEEGEGVRWKWIVLERPPTASNRQGKIS